MKIISTFDQLACTENESQAYNIVKMAIRHSFGCMKVNGKNPAHYMIHTGLAHDGAYHTV